MRKALPVLALMITGAVHAQLINGSFEVDGSPSLTGWEWTCSDPGYANNGAPTSGSWSATKEPGNAKGCFPSLLFQRLPDALDGDLLTVSGWVRCPDGDEPCLGGSLGLGSINAGTFTSDDAVWSQTPQWTYLSITDTVELSAGDTAVVILNGGFIGGPIAPAPSYFDGISLAPALVVGERTGPMIVQYVDHATRTLYISAGQETIQGLRFFDLTGKGLPVRTDRTNATNLRVDLNGLPTGVYFVAVGTSAGERTVRFVNW